MRISKILCPVDFSKPSHGALLRAVDLARESGAQITVLYVHSPGYIEGVAYAPTILAETQSAGERGVAEWAAEIRSLGVATEQVVVMGVPWEEIVNAAQKRGFDLIVMGTHGRTGIQRALIGSVAEKVVRHAPCTVMVVRPAPEAIAAVA